MLRPALLALLLIPLAGCASGPFAPGDATVRACQPMTNTQETTITSQRWAHNVSAPGGYTWSGQYKDLRWAWGWRVPVQVEVEAAWPAGLLGDERVQVRISDDEYNDYGVGEGFSPLAFGFTLRDPPATGVLRVMVIPDSDPDLPAGAAVVLEDRDVHVLVRQTLLCP